MKFNNAIAVTILASAVYAIPQATSTASSASSAAPATTEAPAATFTPTPEQQCITNNCKPEDVVCQASCLGIPAPSTPDANGTTNCAMKCDQGKGSPEDTEKYAQCVQACITSSFLPKKTTPQTAGGSGSGSDGTQTGSGAQATGSSGSGSSNGGSTGGKNATTSGSGSSGSGSRYTVPLTGLAGAIVAFFAIAF